MDTSGRDSIALHYTHYRRHADRMEADARQWGADPVVLRKKLSDLRAEARADIIDATKRALRNAADDQRLALERAAKARAAADEGIDWTRLTARTAEIRAQLSAAHAGAFGGESAVQAAARLHADARAAGDAYTLRALRTASADALSAVDPMGPDSQTASELRHAYEADEEQAYGQAHADAISEAREIEAERLRIGSAFHAAASELMPGGVTEAMQAFISLAAGRDPGAGAFRDNPGASESA